MPRRRTRADVNCRSAMIGVALLLGFVVDAVAAGPAEISGTIRSVDAKARLIFVKIANTKVQVVELEVSRKAKISVDGAEASLEDLRGGQTAVVNYDADLMVATRIKAIGSGDAVPEIASVTEVNTTKRDFCPWLSPDGLTIYWVTDLPSDPEGEIWSASRKDAGSLFGDKRMVGYGRHIAVSSNGLTIYSVARRTDGQQRFSLHVARRRSTVESFGRSQEVQELKALDFPRNLFLSADGLTLMFNDGSFTTRNGTFRLAMAKRQTPQSRWGKPQPVPNALDNDERNLVTWPFMTKDGLSFVCTLTYAGIKGGDEFVTMSRTKTDQPFSDPVTLSLPGVQEFVGWGPRYVEATHELFFTSDRLSPEKNQDIWVVRNFKLIANGKDNPINRTDTKERTK